MQSSSAATSSTGGTDDHPACVARDPEVVGDLELTLSTWPVMAPGHTRVELSSECGVESFEREGLTSRFELSCQHEAYGPTLVTAAVTMPTDLRLSLEAGATVKLALEARVTVSDLWPGAQMVLRDGTTSDLLLAVYDDATTDELSSWSERMAPLRAELDTSLCAPVCRPEFAGECDPSKALQSWRHGIQISESGSRVNVLDGLRAVLDGADGRQYDVVVASASGEVQVTYNFDYRVLIAPGSR